jgi:hypothetical protein
MVDFTAEDFLKLGLHIVNRGIKSDAVARERFQANYGTEAVVVADVWLRLMNSQWSEKCSMKPVHLLWSLSVHEVIRKAMRDGTKEQV